MYLRTTVYNRYGEIRNDSKEKGTWKEGERKGGRKRKKMIKE